MISLKKTFRMGIGSVILCLFSAAGFAQMSSSDTLHLLDLIQNQRYDHAPADHRPYVEYSTHRIGELSKGK